MPLQRPRALVVDKDTAETQALLGLLEASGFEVLRTYAPRDERPVPPRLKAIFNDDVLTTPQILMVARRI